MKNVIIKCQSKPVSYFQVKSTWKNFNKSKNAYNENIKVIPLIGTETLSYPKILAKKGTDQNDGRKSPLLCLPSLLSTKITTCWNVLDRSNKVTISLSFWFTVILNPQPCCKLGLSSTTWNFAIGHIGSWQICDRFFYEI